MNPRLAKNLTGMAGYFKSANVSQTNSATSNNPPTTSEQMVAADFHGYMVPPQDTPMRNRVSPAVHRKMPR